MTSVSLIAMLCGAVYEPSGETCTRPVGNHKWHTVDAGVRSITWPNSNYRMSGRQLSAREDEAKMIRLAERLRESRRTAVDGLDVDGGGHHRHSDRRPHDDCR
jgi:hypothetical protein